MIPLLEQEVAFGCLLQNPKPVVGWCCHGDVGGRFVVDKDTFVIFSCRVMTTMMNALKCDAARTLTLFSLSLRALIVFAKRF